MGIPASRTDARILQAITIPVVQEQPYVSISSEEAETSHRSPVTSLTQRSSIRSASHTDDRQNPSISRSKAARSLAERLGVGKLDIPHVEPTSDPQCSTHDAQPPAPEALSSQSNLLQPITGRDRPPDDEQRHVPMRLLSGTRMNDTIVQPLQPRVSRTRSPILSLAERLGHPPPASQISGTRSIGSASINERSGTAAANIGPAGQPTNVPLSQRMLSAVVSMIDSTENIKQEPDSSVPLMSTEVPAITEHFGTEKVPNLAASPERSLPPVTMTTLSQDRVDAIPTPESIDPAPHSVITNRGEGAEAAISDGHRAGPMYRRSAPDAPTPIQSRLTCVFQSHLLPE